MEGDAKGKTFKMKGHTLPGINQRSETKNLADGRSKSSAFQFGTGAGTFAASQLSNKMMQNQAAAPQPVRNVPTNAPLGTPLNQKDKERFSKEKKKVDPKNPKGYPKDPNKMTKEEKAYWDKLAKEK